MCTLTNFIEEHGDIWLTPLFWDCECEDDYIHPASEPVCYRCHFKREESPDARVPEVLKSSCGCCSSRFRRSKPRF